MQLGLMDTLDFFTFFSLKSTVLSIYALESQEAAGKYFSEVPVKISLVSYLIQPILIPTKYYKILLGLNKNGLKF